MSSPILIYSFLLLTFVMEFSDETWLKKKILFFLEFMMYAQLKAVLKFCMYCRISTYHQHDMLLATGFPWLSIATCCNRSSLSAGHAVSIQSCCWLVVVHQIQWWRLHSTTHEHGGGSAAPAQRHRVLNSGGTGSQLLWSLLRLLCGVSIWQQWVSGMDPL